MNEFLDRILDGIYMMGKDAHQRRCHLEFRKKFDIHPSAVLGPDSELYGTGTIEIGSGTKIGWRTTIQSISPCKVFIGNDCEISHNVSIYTMNRIPDDKYSRSKGNVIIGDDVWIGKNVMILENSIIGSGSTIGANSVVRRNERIPPDSVYAGIPAKMIRRLYPWE